jgi:benzoyl-CoA reductase/2-hydroxyglutaryl-CoA dehydratase subunit BcrC/BadD/HgdB
MIKKLESNKRMGELLQEYYLRGFFEEKNCWITSGGPVEFLYSMDIYPVYPENHAALIGAAKEGPKYASIAEEGGFSQDLCSYARSDIGSATIGDSPAGGLPKPTLLLSCNNICNTVVKWYQVLGRMFNVPHFLLDMPFIRKELKDSYIDHIVSQLYDLIDFLEKQMDKKFDEKRFSDTLLLSLEGIKTYGEALHMGRHKPSPMTCFDGFINMAPIVCLRGTDAPLGFYHKMKEELEERIKNGISAVDDEKIRLLWDNIPVWYRLRSLSEFFSDHNACLVADTYTNAWLDFGELSSSDPIRGVAEAYAPIYLNIGIERMAEKINDLIAFYDVDGVVMHSNRSCKPYSFAQYELQRLIDVPSVIIEADQTDSRAFSEQQVQTRLEAFLEMLI